MPVFLLSDDLKFPDPRLATREGILAVGGDLSRERLVLAYRMGIFPWFSGDEPVLWWSPDPRFVLFPSRLRVGRSLLKTLRANRYEVRLDCAFEEVVRQCASVSRPDQPGTWITPRMHQAYLDLHHAGLAHSVECWQAGALVGGLYGVAMGAFFFGESMFALRPDASKVALVALVQKCRGAQLIDCQVYTPFFEDMGAEMVPRESFLRALARHIDDPSVWRGTE